LSAVIANRLAISSSLGRAVVEARQIVQAKLKIVGYLAAAATTSVSSHRSAIQSLEYLVEAAARS